MPAPPQVPHRSAPPPLSLRSLGRADGPWVLQLYWADADADGKPSLLEGVWVSNIPRDAATDGVLADFKREGEALAKTSHPNVLRFCGVAYSNPRAGGPVSTARLCSFAVRI